MNFSKYRVTKYLKRFLKSELMIVSTFKYLGVTMDIGL